MGDAEDDVAAREPNGEADEGEEIAELVEQVEREGEEANSVVDDDSSDEEDTYPVLRNWSNYDYFALQVNVEENVPWEYRENEV